MAKKTGRTQHRKNINITWQAKGHKQEHDGKKRSRAVKIATIVISLLILYLLQLLLIPKYVDGIVEGSFISEYYKEKNKDFDVIFVGDCEIYENISPIELWKEYGINSYIRGSPDQYIMQSYYMIEDTLRYNKPDVVVFNVLALQNNYARSEPYNRMTLDGMQWSISKVKAILASMRPGEHFVDYLFPILRFHSRWSDLRSTDFEYMFTRNNVSYNGYYLRTDIRAPEFIPESEVPTDYTFGDNAWKYMDLMVNLCEEKGISLLLVKAPSLFPRWYDEWDEQVIEYAERHNLPYINFLNLIDTIGIDYNYDTCDGGAHLNVYGAKKLSYWLGQYLINNMGIEDRRNEEELQSIWNEKIIAYEAEISG